MRKITIPALAATALFAVTVFGTTAIAAQSNGLEDGMRYCPAPWCDNSEFLDTHFGIDAKTGQMTKYTGTVHPDEIYGTNGPGEQVLFVAPPVDVQNRFVPPSVAFQNQGLRQPAPAQPLWNQPSSQPVTAYAQPSQQVQQFQQPYQAPQVQSPQPPVQVYQPATQSQEIVLYQPQPYQQQLPQQQFHQQVQPQSYQQPQLQQPYQPMQRQPGRTLQSAAAGRNQPARQSWWRDLWN
ncbi:MAG: hypothetical protein LIP23_08465 [Planctomycetes bacterium]|nr:hypothetical protein [Planctomycetota bacterium]